MKNSRMWLIGGAVVAGVGLAAAARLPRGAARASREGTAAGRIADSSVVDADAIKALESMGKYLRTLKAIDVHAVVTREEVQTDGQKVQTTSNVDLLAQRPNRLRVEVADDRQPRLFYYDGKTFTLWAPRLRFYTKVDAPSNIEELADQLEDRYHVDLPLVDLFRWGTKEADDADITSAEDLGPSTVDGVTCEQYLFRQDGLDWQLWVQQGDYPLPKKVVISTTTDDARPQYTAVWTWNLAPSFNDQEFVFTAPADAKPVPFATDLMARLGTKTGGPKK